MTRVDFLSIRLVGGNVAEKLSTVQPGVVRGNFGEQQALADPVQYGNRRDRHWIKSKTNFEPFKTMPAKPAPDNSGNWIPKQVNSVFERALNNLDVFNELKDDEKRRRP